MEIIFVLLRNVVVKDRLHVLHVDAPGSHVGGYQNFQLVLPEFRHHLIAQCLGHIPMETVHGAPALLQPLGELPHGAFHVGEHHHPVVVLLLDDLQHILHTLGAGGADEILVDMGAAVPLGRHLHLHGVVLVFPRHVHDLPRDGGAEHHHLGVPRGGVEDAAHILDEAHFQHFVRFIQHGGVYIAQPDVAPAHMIQQPPGGSHYNVGVLFQGVDLLAHGLPAVDGGNADGGVKPHQRPQIGGDLLAQLPGGADDHRLQILHIRIEALDQRDAEGAGLAGAGGGFGDHVPPLQHQGDGFQLHRGGGIKSHRIQRFHGRLAQGQSRKSVLFQ